MANFNLTTEKRSTKSPIKITVNISAYMVFLQLYMERDLTNCGSTTEPN